MKDTVSKIFETHPENWGLKGDSYFWKELEEFFSNIYLPYPVERFTSNFCIIYKIIIGDEISPNQNYYIPKYDKGGISSGMIESDFWINTALPLLTERLEKLNEEFNKIKQ